VPALWALVFLAYEPAWHGTPLWDDAAHITRPDLRSLHGLGRIWTDVGATQQYYPLLHSVFWLEYQLWGDATTGYHLVNIGLHTLAATLVWLLLRRLGVPGAALAAAVFALHPVQVESVAWITELKNTLSAVFCLGAALAYLRFDSRRSRVWYAWALGLFILGLLSKTVTAVLPGAMLVLFWWRQGRLSWKRDCLPLAPFFVLGALAGGVTAIIERKIIGAVGAQFDFTAVERCLIAGRVVFFYLGKLVWPAGLMFMYPRWQVSGGPWWQYLYPAAALLLLALLLVLSRRRRGPLATGLLYLGALFPVLGFFNVYPFLFSFVADHFQYLAMIAPVAAGAALLTRGIADMTDRVGSWLAGGAGVCAAVLLAGLTFLQAGIYRDAPTLWRNVLDQNPRCWMAHANYGVYLREHGQTEQAIAHDRAALEINPRSAEAYNNLGLALTDRGQVDEAIAQYRKALEIQPNLAEGHINLGNALVQRGQLDEAIVHYQKAIELRPDFVEPQNNLAAALGRKGQITAAIAHLRKALEIDPDIAQTHDNLGLLLAGEGQFDEAIVHYRRALEIDPNFAKAHNHLGMTLAARGQVEEAVAHFQKALTINPDYAAARRNLEAIQGQQR
jgi:tetratricopeptide (TPR) repeat protein